MTTKVALGVLAGLGLLATAVGGAVAPATEDTVGLPSSPLAHPTASGSSPAADVSSAAPSVSPDDGTAMAALVTLQVRGRAPKTGYGRDQFGQKWADVDRNGCDTRNDVLRRDLADARTTPGSHGCAVALGMLADPYSGAMIEFDRGNGSSKGIHIDHVVALSDAWQKGAQQWDQRERTAFANDPLNLLAVQGTANMQKGDGDAATWLPPNKTYRCNYVTRQVTVKAKYGLWVTQAEHDVMDVILMACPTMRLVTSAEPPPTTDSIESIPAPGTTQSTSAAPSTTPSLPAPATAAPDDFTGSAQDPAPVDVHYENCAAAREAGAAPLLMGEPGYRPALDGDKDGVACE